MDREPTRPLIRCVASTLRPDSEIRTQNAIRRVSERNRDVPPSRAGTHAAPVVAIADRLLSDVPIGTARLERKSRMQDDRTRLGGLLL